MAVGREGSVVAKEQINIRITRAGKELLAALVAHFSARHADGGRTATQAEVIERAIRLLATREKIPKNSPDRD
jgi:Na+-transporting NADH:ubiquinone oxidoreductase subunit NqrF